ncbi:MAG TPA: cob(I)yrinic acid a,c-diamide adenosyltransferase [Thermodesulfobacteriota bacterium]|jgi:cob(I)alamin adenosyltransferase|nr:cob(I)yrinic acid a,c-diamide adenosyltransferase [Thermodesulfobacteriota bacterium]
MIPDSEHWNLGFLQVYTGNGKGKTTAAFGLALRAAGAGLRVFIAQFVKGMKYSEIEAFERFSDLITVRQYGRGCFIRDAPKEEDTRVASVGLHEVQQVLCSGDYKVIILDEANIATHFRLFSVDDLLALIDLKPPDVELVITGRNVDRRVLERADLVTEMREIKHYYTKGVAARRGIES